MSRPENTWHDQVVEEAVGELLATPVPSGPTEDVVRKVLGALRQQPDALIRRRPALVRRIVPAAAFLVVAGAAAVALLLFLKPAYALEDTTEALRNVQFVHTVRRDEAGEVVDERWIEVGADGFQVRYRQETRMPHEEEGFLVIEDGETVARYRASRKAVILYDPEDQQWQWIGDLHGFLEDLSGRDTAVIEENVAYKGRRAHHVRWNKLNVDCYVDAKTKLPMSFARTEMSYEVPAPDVFEIVIPNGYMVVDRRPGAPAASAPEWLREEAEQDGDADTAFDQGRSALSECDYGRAAELFGQAARAQPGRNWAWFWLGRAYFELGRLEEAVEAYTQVIDMFRKLAGQRVIPHYCYLARGLAYRELGREEDARKDFAVALPMMISALSDRAGFAMFDYADDPLYRSDPTRRPTPDESLTRMIHRLRAATGQSFGREPGTGAEDVRRVVSAWQQWWQEHKSDCRIDVP